MICKDNRDEDADQGVGTAGRGWALHLMDVLVAADLRMCTHDSHERGMSQRLDSDR
jgi:hypothetical protein